MEEFSSTSNSKKADSSDASAGSSERGGTFISRNAEASATVPGRADFGAFLFEKLKSEAKEKDDKAKADKTDTTTGRLSVKSVTERAAKHKQTAAETPVGTPEQAAAATAQNFNEAVKERLADPHDTDPDPVASEAEAHRAELRLPQTETPAPMAPEELVNEDSNVAPPAPVESDLWPAKKRPPVEPVFAPPPAALSWSEGLPGATPIAAKEVSTPSPTLSKLESILDPEGKRLPTAQKERSKKVGPLATSLLAGGALLAGRRNSEKAATKRTPAERPVPPKEVRSTPRQLAAREQELKDTAVIRLREASEERIARPAPKPAAEVLRQTVAAPETVAVAAPLVSTAESNTSDNTGTHELTQAANDTQAENRTLPVTEQVAKLSTPELLQRAATLYIEGASVRHLYETNQIDRRGLEIIVQESLRDGDIAAAFSQVELGHERQAERAREFRHDPAADDSSSDDAAAPNPTTEPQLPPLTPPPLLPNTPDASQLQPLSNLVSENDKNDLKDSLTALRPQPKTTQVALAAVSAFAIAFLIIWALVS